MKKFLVALLVIICILCILATAIYFGSGPIFDAAADRILPRFLPRLAEHGIRVENYEYSSIRFMPPRTITVSDLRAVLNLKIQDQEYEANFHAKKLNFHFSNIKDPYAFVSCDNFELYVDRAEDLPGTSFGRFDEGYIELRNPIRLKDPGDGIKAMLQKVSAVFNEEEIDPDVNVRALVTLRVRGKESQAFLYTTPPEDGASLRFDEKDIRRIADTFGQQLSDEEIAIIAGYPLRAPIIMRITSDAKETSREARRSDRSVPEDAYRHVLWSYLLTQKFGPEFAEQVTDAHETLPTNTAAERRMDFRNNLVGREIAQAGMKREHILDFVKKDPIVIRNPEDI